MNRKRAIIILVLLMGAIALFEFAYFYDFNASETTFSHERNQQNYWVFFAMMLLPYIPCTFMGIAQMSPFMGLIPPIILNTIFWLILSSHFQCYQVNFFTLDNRFTMIPIGLTILSGIFGILVVSISTRFTEPEDEEEDDEEGASAAPGETAEAKEVESEGKKKEEPESKDGAEENPEKSEKT